tara:strand:+ start:196 stop:414 length:219 start_codon:yes stop_codon:yes gene_type:complete
MLLANITVFSAFLCSKYEKAIARILAIGRAIINPDNSGFFPESQLAKAITNAAKITLKAKIIIFYFILNNKN